MSDDEYGICLQPECHDSEPPKEMPSMFQQASGFINSAKDVIGGVMAGEGLKVTEEVYNERMALCMSCEFLEKEHVRCTKCGCFMKVKSAFKKTYCPVGKWNAIQ